MAGLKSVFDTVILIDALNGIGPARRDIALVSGIDRLISIMTLIEVLAGMKPGDVLRTRRFLARFTVVPISDSIAERSAELRRTSKLKLPDAIIVATAELHRVQLVTRNTRDFSVIDPRIRVSYIF
jgi:predicted nucleic acid-binding protein